MDTRRQPEIQPAGELHRAHYVVERQRRLRQFGLGGQKGVVETGVVGDQRAPVHHVGQAGSDVFEGRLVLEHLGRQAVHVGGPGIHAGVEQADHRLLDLALGVQRQCGDAENAGVARTEPRCLDVDDDPAPVLFTGRSTPGVAHNRQNGTRPRQPSADRIRVGRPDTGSA